MIYRHKKTTAQVLVRWCLDHGFVVIPKSVKEQRIIENASVFDFQLSPEDLQLMVCFIDFTELLSAASVPGLPLSVYVGGKLLSVCLSVLRDPLYRVV